MRLLALYLLLGMQLLIQVSVADESVGRLFSTPEQRSQLDALRESKRNQPVAKAETIVQPTVIKRRPIVLPDTVKVQGYVKRTDGKKGTVWVNGKAVQEHTRNKGVQVGKLPEKGNRVPIRIQANGKRLHLKAGQVYNPKTNKIKQSRSYRIKKNAGRIGYASAR